MTRCTAPDRLWYFHHKHSSESGILNFRRSVILAMAPSHPILFKPCLALTQTTTYYVTSCYETLPFSPTYLRPPLSLSHSSYFWPLGMVAPFRDRVSASCASLTLASVRSASLRSASLRSARSR